MSAQVRAAGCENPDTLPTRCVGSPTLALAAFSAPAMISPGSLPVRTTSGACLTKLLQRMVKLHYNWKYTFLRPSLAKIIERYNLKFGAKQPAPPSPPTAPGPTAAAPSPAAPSPAPASTTA